jgi:hypothetical protein
LALTSSTSGGRLVGIVRSRIQATQFSFFSFVAIRIYIGLGLLGGMIRFETEIFFKQIAKQPL